MLQYISTSKGHRKLVHDGFMYTMKKQSPTSVFWECVKGRTEYCRGTVRIAKSDDAIANSTQHNHDPSQEEINVAVARSSLKRKIEDSPLAAGSKQATISESLSSLTPSERIKFGTIASVQRSVCRYAAKNQPSDPQCLEDLIIDGSWTENNDGSSFLIDDNKNNSDRIIIFGSNACLSHLATSTIWMMDGTFKVAPNLFKQLYVIRAPLENTSISCVYALMTRKTEASYINLLRTVVTKCKDIGIEVNPQKVVMDFEMAMIKAVRHVFGWTAEIHGCFFHLCQSTWRKIQSLGLSSLYKNDLEVREFCGMLNGLAFLPEDEVVEGLFYLRSIVPSSLESLINYFDQTYVTGTHSRTHSLHSLQSSLSLNVHSTPPLFPLELWNVNQATLQDGARTNNICEAWNSGFNRRVRKAHPTVWLLIEALRADNMKDELSIARYRQGLPIPSRVNQKSKQLEAQLKQLCLNYESAKISLQDLLLLVGQTIRLTKLTDKESN